MTTWSEDVCTCGHVVSVHQDRGAGRCNGCDADASYKTEPQKAPTCLRFQWDGEPRRKTW